MLGVDAMSRSQVCQRLDGRDGRVHALGFQVFLGFRHEHLSKGGRPEMRFVAVTQPDGEDGVVQHRGVMRGLDRGLGGKGERHVFPEQDRMCPLTCKTIAFSLADRHEALADRISCSPHGA